MSKIWRNSTTTFDGTWKFYRRTNPGEGWVRLPGLLKALLLTPDPQTPFQARTEAAINAGKVSLHSLCALDLSLKPVQAEQDKIYAAQLAYETQLADPELVFRSISFANLVSTWLIRQVDPLKKHPNPTIE